jgi:hypothetical protein
VDGAGQVGMELELEFSSDRFARMDWMTAKGREEPAVTRESGRSIQIYCGRRLSGTAVGG